VHNSCRYLDSISPNYDDLCPLDGAILHGSPRRHVDPAISHLANHIKDLSFYFDLYLCLCYERHAQRAWLALVCKLWEIVLEGRCAFLLEI